MEIATEREEVVGEDPQIVVEVRPLPIQHVVRTVLSRRMFNERCRVHKVRGSTDEEFDAALWTLVDVAQKFEGSPVVWIERDSVGHVGQHDGIALYGIVTFMPKVVVSKDTPIETFVRTVRSRIVSLLADDSLTGVTREIEAIRDELQKGQVSTTDPIEEQDGVVIDAWNTGLGSGAKVRLALRLDRSVMPELTNLLVGQVGGCVSVGSYPIVAAGQNVKAQKIELIGKVTPNRAVTDARLLELLEVASMQEVEEIARKRLLASRDRRLAIAIGKLSIEIETLPSELVSQIAEVEAAEEIRLEGPATVMRRYGVDNTEALLDAIIETRVGVTTRADVVLYWLARHLKVSPDEATLRQYADHHKIPNRVVALFRFCREQVIQSLLNVQEGHDVASV